MAKATAPFPEMVCIDANVVFDLVDHESASAGVSAARKHPNLVGCLSRMRAAKAELFVTPHILEEFLRRELTQAMGREAGSRGCKDEKELRSRYPEQHMDVRRNAAKLFRNAVASVRKHGIKVLLPSPSADKSSAQHGQEATELLIQLIQTRSAIGGKDIVHIVVAGHAGCRAFVSRDGGFAEVPALTVYTR